MSDLQDLIHTNAHNAYGIGVTTERERIIKLAKNRICFDHKNGCDHASCYALCDLIELIQKEEK
jgi:hypothetical protein